MFVPVLLSLTVYYGFCTGYTKQVFSETSFRDRSSHDVFKYRIVGRTLLLKTYELLASKNKVASGIRARIPQLPPSIKVLDNKANRTFYAAYFLHNTLFLVLAAVVLYILLARRDGRDSGVVSLIHMLGISLIALTQFAITAYDNLSIFLVLLSILLMVRRFRLRLPLLLAVQILSTLTRESSALTVPFYFAYFHGEILKGEKRALVELAALAGAFAVTYGLLRLWLGPSRSFYIVPTYAHNMQNVFSIAGMLLMIVITYLLCEGSPNRRSCLLFLAASSPYIVGMLIVGVTWEIRLWIPIWLPLMVLARAVTDQRLRPIPRVGGGG